MEDEEDEDMEIDDDDSAESVGEVEETRFHRFDRIASQSARVTLDAQALQRDVSHIRHTRRAAARRPVGPTPPAEVTQSRRHRSDGVVASWAAAPRSHAGSGTFAGAAPGATVREREGHDYAAVVEAVGGTPTPVKSGMAASAATAWPSSLHAVPPVRAAARRRRRSSHLSAALRRKVSAVWPSGAARAASTTAAAALAASDARHAEPPACGRGFAPVEHGEAVDDSDDGTEEGFSGSGSGSRSGSGSGSGSGSRTASASGSERAACTRAPRPCAGRAGQAVHPYAALAPFGLSSAGDMIVLYTNWVRAEVNDLIFLATLLRRAAGPDGAGVRKRHRSLDVDFELWFSRFAQYCGLVLFGIEELVMRSVADVLGSRDVMLSRAAAAAEAGGAAASRAAAWNAASRALYARMDAVRAGLNDVAAAVVWLRRARALREDGAPAAQRAVAGVRRLAPAVLALMDDVDARVGEALALGADWSRALRPLYRRFAAVLAREGAAPLGWGAVVTLTRWIADRRLRAEHVRAVARAARLGVFARFKGDCSHQAIVRVHQTLATDDTRRVRFFV